MPDRYIHTQGVKTTGVYNSYAMLHVRLSKNMYVPTSFEHKYLGECNLVQA